MARALGRAFSYRQRVDEEAISPEGLYERAMRLQREGKLEAALASYSDVILADPEFAEAYLGRATTCYLLGNCDQAINDCNRAIELRRDFVEAYFTRGAAYWGLASELPGDDPYILGFCEQAISDCTVVIVAQPRHGQAYFNRGMAYWALSNRPMAKHDLENAVALIKHPGWHAEAEAWLKELKKPRLLSRYERDSWHTYCGK
ncbi:MAG: tetratricopeptide repeat protein [Betaproteobacteria bacterium]|nr:tetratricopeptide repeat protein [Betaproteobacteria bacterium]